MSNSHELAAILASLEKINARLDALETNDNKSISNLKAPHASLDKFSVAEAIVDSLFETEEKACTFEPSKPCDHCSICNSRGF